MNPYGQYQQAYKRASVTTIDQGKLIVMLYDGAIKHTSIAIEKMKQKDIEGTHNNLIKAKNIITELMVSLNEEKGGQIAKNLKSLYNYMFGQLIEANINKNPEAAQTVIKLLKDLREAWVAIGSSQPTSMPTAPQSLGTGGPQQVKSIRLKG